MRLAASDCPVRTCLLWLGWVLVASMSFGQGVEAILEATGFDGGLIVHVGCGDGTLTAALRTNDRTIVQGLDTNPAGIEKARKNIHARGLYGPVSVRQFDGERLPYVDNLVNAIVVADGADIAESELLRTLAPYGVAVRITPESEMRGRKLVKPWPSGIDDWPQYLHGADNNAVAQDTVVGPPRRLQWSSGPRWCRSHMSLPSVVTVVSAHGRLFRIEDASPVENPFLPGRFRLTAQDAFNGIQLWTHDFSGWDSITRYVKDQAVQLQRRIAATAEVVYCTPGLNAPVTAFDARTGKVLRTFEATERTQELAYDNGVLFLVIGDPMTAARYNIVKTYSGKGVNTGGSVKDGSFGGTGFDDGYASQAFRKRDPLSTIVAVDAKRGEMLWKTAKLTGYIASTLAIRGETAVYQTVNGFFCVERSTGDVRWKKEKKIPSHDGTEPNTVVLAADAVYAQEGRVFRACALKDGAEFWSAPIKHNYEKAADLYVIGNEVWTGGSGPPTAYDARTGEKRRVIKQKFTGPMGHDRCYRNLITTRYYINSKTGGSDFCTLDGKRELPNLWVRGTCGFGVLPCNGMLYATPYSCQCSAGVMFPGMNAMTTVPDILEPKAGPEKIEWTIRRVKGPAYERPVLVEAGEGAWPTYRGDPARSGSTATPVPAELARKWRVSVGAMPSAPTIAAGMVFVAIKDSHQVCALDAASGKELWRYTAGGRIDSPPTFHKGRLVFGCRDGWVHCLRARDGVLAWRMNALPDRLVGSYGQVESAWPVSGSVLVHNDIVYYAAGRNQNLDGGIFLFGVKLGTGELLHRKKTAGNMDVLVLEEGIIHMRHAAATLDLERAAPVRHVLPVAGFLDGVPQHRTYWTVGGKGYARTDKRPPCGDILVKRGNAVYEVQGFPVHRHSYFDPRVKGYALFAGEFGAKPAPKGKKAGRARSGRKRGQQGIPQRWQVGIPCTGMAMALAGDIVFVAGTPSFFPPDHPTEKYAAAYRGERGGLLVAVATGNGDKLAEMALEAAPAWDGMAAGGRKLYLALQDGSVCCLAPPAGGHRAQ